jgi:hypothetical protein
MRQREMLSTNDLIQVESGWVRPTSQVKWTLSLSSRCRVSKGLLTWSNGTLITRATKEVRLKDSELKAKLHGLTISSTILLTFKSSPGRSGRNSTLTMSTRLRSWRSSFPRSLDSQNRVFNLTSLNWCHMRLNWSYAIKRHPEEHWRDKESSLWKWIWMETMRRKWKIGTILNERESRRKQPKRWEST